MNISPLSSLTVLKMFSFDSLTTGCYIRLMLKLYQDLKYPFSLPELMYAYDALEPHIDARTMEIHHTKHHQTYITKLNAALEKYPELQSWSLADLLTRNTEVPDDIHQAIINHGGGHANHLLFWQILSPAEKGAPTGKIADMINETFGSIDTFKDKFTEEATNRFGSGWAWLLVNKDGSNLHIGNTPNQNSPLLEQHIPLLGLDVWEHAYYLLYQSRRPDYIQAWWNVVNWNRVNELLQELV